MQNCDVTFWQKLLDFVYPRICVGCGKEGVFLCDECFTGLEIAEQMCPMCGRGSAFGWTHKQCLREDGMEGLICLYSYEDQTVKKAVDELKFGFNREMVNLLLKDFVFESGMMFDAIVPVPLYFYRENWRGFNQAELIAREVGKRMSVEIGNYLNRKRNTKQQSTLEARQDREVNMRGSFRAIDAKKIRRGRFLLVDDVFTSGASMREAARELKRAGADTVWGLALAH